MSEREGPGEGWANDWRGLAERVRAVARAAQAAEKRLKGVPDPRGVPLEAAAAIATVRDVVAAAEALAAGGGASLDEVQRAVDDLAARWRLTRLGAIRDAAARADLPFAQLTSDEVRVGEATVLLKLDRGTAEVRYAREPLATVPADAEAIVAEVRRQIGALAAASPEPPALFDQLVAAYRALIGRRGLAFGDRVELVDLLPELFVLRQPDAFWKKQDPKRLQPVSRAQLAWDLDRLQRARALTRNGLRLVLGTATGGSTAKKAQVLFLEAGSAGGQYYLTFAVRRADA